MSFKTDAYTSRGRFIRTKFSPSSVDESLFGDRKKSREPDPVPEFEPPWIDNGKTKLKPPPRPLLFYCPSSPSRPASRASSASSNSPARKYKPVKFTSTFVDDTLFGQQKKEQYHNLQTEKYFTSVTKTRTGYELNLDDGDVVCSSYRPNSRSRFARAQSARVTTPAQPPWR